MSPARARTSLPEIVAAGRALLESGGLDAVTMQAVAARVGVRAPSLYKRIPDRTALIAAISDDIAAELGNLMTRLADAPDPASGLRSVATAFRAYAHAHPRSYELLFMHLPAGGRASPERNAAASAPLLSLTARLVGQDHALEAARLVTAFSHGFVSMELNGAFRLGGDVDEAYRYGIDVLVEAIAQRGGARRAGGLAMPALARRSVPGP
jgi:AcrR family transcriptional regulator